MPDISVSVSIIDPSRVPPARDVLAVCALYVQRCVRENFEALDRARSVYGHAFYLREGASRTNWEFASDEEARVVVSSAPMRHKLTGGSVTPKNAKHLAIPVSETARRRAVSPRRFGKKLFLIKSKRKNLLLAEKGGKNKLIIHYWLADGVVHKARPETLPTESAIQAAVDGALNELLSRRNLG